MKYTDQPLTHFFLPRESLDGAPSGIVAEATATQTPIVERIRDGIQFREFSTLQALLKIPEEALGRYLGMSNATLHRRE